MTNKYFSVKIKTSFKSEWLNKLKLYFSEGGTFMEEESFEIKVVLGEKEIKEAILDYLDKHGYIVSDYNYKLGVRVEKEDTGILSKRTTYHFNKFMIDVKRKKTTPRSAATNKSELVLKSVSKNEAIECQ